MFRATTLGALCLAAALVPLSAGAETWTVTITNATGGTYFTPLMVAAHDDAVDAFEVGQPASPQLRATAECGDTSGLIAAFGAAGADFDNNPAGGALAPGSSATAVLTPSRGNDRLTIAGMLVPTNDGFFGLDAVEVPKLPGTYTWAVNGYDAGTEANDEILNDTTPCAPGVPGMPGDPTGLAGSGATGVTTFDYNTNVHVHPGPVGDLDPTGGPSDLDAGVHRWVNPIAYVTVTVDPRRHGRHDKDHGY
jgi:Spondin_N